MLVVVYSPLCERNGEFLGLLEEWLDNTGILIRAVPFNDITDREKEWYASAGLVRDGRFKKSVFIHVFFEGELIDSVPLKREAIEKGLHIQIQGEEDRGTEPRKLMSETAFRELVCTNEIQWVPLTKDTYRDEMRLCLENYPYGNPADRFHNRCITIKEKVFEEVFSKVDTAGVFAVWGNAVVGLIEVFPREIVRKYGYLTGSHGKDENYLTVGCLEVGYGIPRKEMIDELFFQLERLYPKLCRHFIEGVGTFEWNTGFTPYWVYDKYGFCRSETINEKTVVMEKDIQNL